MGSQPDSSTFRSYLIFFSGQMASLLGSSVAQFAVIWWVTLTTGSALYLSLAAFIGIVPMVIIMPFAGVLADKSERRRFIAVVDFLQSVTTVLLIIAFWTGFASLWLVLAMIGVRGACQAFHMPAVNSIVPAMVPREKLSRMNGLSFLLSGAAQLLAPMMGAFLLLFARIDQILWIDPVTFLVALLALLTIKIPRVREASLKTSFRKDFHEGLSFIHGARGFLPLIVLATSLNFLLAPLSALLPYYVKFDHLGDASSLALVLTCLQGGVLGGGLVMSVFKGFKNKIAMSLVFVTVVFIGYAVVALTPTGNFWFMSLGAAVMGFALAPANVLLSTVIQTVVPIELMGRVDSVTGSLASAATPAGILLSGAIAGLISTSMVFLACAAAGIALLLFSLTLTDITLVERLHAQKVEPQQEPTTQPH